MLNENEIVNGQNDSPVCGNMVNFDNSSNCNNSKDDELKSKLLLDEDPAFEKALKELKNFIVEYDNLIERQANIKENIQELFKNLKNRGFKNKALKVALKIRKEKISNNNFELDEEDKKFYYEVLVKIDENY